MTLRVSPNINSKNTIQRNQQNISFGNLGRASQAVFNETRSRNLLSQPNIFERLGNLGMEGLKHLIGFTARLKPVQKLTERLQKVKNLVAHMLAAVSIALTALTIRGYYKSEKIEKDQKLPLILNQILTTAVTVTGGYTVDGMIEKTIFPKFEKIFMNENESYMEKILKESKGKIDKKFWLDGLKYAKTFIIFGFLYRYLGPVVVTPVANKLSTMLVNAKQKHLEKQAKENV